MSHADLAVPSAAPNSIWEAYRWLAVQIGRGALQMLRLPKPDSLAPRPAHVPPERVVDFDFVRQPGLVEDIHGAWKRLHEGPDIFWTPRNGGCWVVTRADGIDAVLRDPETFSSSKISIPKEATVFKMLPIEADPPEHANYRSLINPWFTPKAISSMEHDIRSLAVELIEGFLTDGECEFVEAFAKRLPIVVFLKLVNLPLDDREKLLRWTDDAVRAKSAWQRMKAFLLMNTYLDKWIRQRRAHPGDDLISRVVTASVGGRPITHGEIHGMLTVLMFGGLDTVAAMLSFAAGFLASHPEHRQQLVDQPALIPKAVDELMRRHGIVNLGRVVTRDCEFKGVQLKKGEMVQVPNALLGLDESRFDDPMTVDFNRPSLIHGAFGTGPHRCPGAYLARTEIRIFLEEWLKRIPVFSIKPGTPPAATQGL